MPDLPDVERLSALMTSEAARVLAHEHLVADPVLVKQGWERRFVADAARAREAAELYQQLGYEVRLEPVLPEHFAEPCEACALITLLRFQMIYTRRVP